MGETGIRSNNSIYLVWSTLTRLRTNLVMFTLLSEAQEPPRVLPDASSSRVSLPSPDCRAVGITFSHVPLWTPALAPRSISLAQMTGCIHGSSFWQNGCWAFFSKSHPLHVSCPHWGRCQWTMSGPCCSPHCVSHFERWGFCKRLIPSLPKTFVLFMKIPASFPQH